MSFRAQRVCILLTAGLITSLGLAGTASAQTAKDKLDKAKNQQELLILQATADLQVKQKEAEARKAIAEAGKAEYAAQLPATDTKALAGKVNTEKFGAAGLVKAFDLALELSREVCKNLRANTGATYAIESLKIGDSSDKSPLYNAARYLSYSDRIKTSHILDFDLTLEGMTITRDSIFTGQRLSLSGVALLWYRVHQQDGTLLQAKTVRRISAPIGIDLKGDEAPSGFWTQL